jgi:hypothetical protein
MHSAVEAASPGSWAGLPPPESQPSLARNNKPKAAESHTQTESETSSSKHLHPNHHSHDSTNQKGQGKWDVGYDQHRESQAQKLTQRPVKRRGDEEQPCKLDDEFHVFSFYVFKFLLLKSSPVNTNTQSEIEKENQS